MWNNDRWDNSDDMYDSEMERRRLQNTYGTRNMGGPPSLFSGRPGSSISSSNQINSNLFDDYPARRNSSNTYRNLGSYNPIQSGRVNRNSLSDYIATKRILQKRALNAAGTGTILNSTMINSFSMKRKRKPKPKPAQANNTTNSTVNSVKADETPKLNLEKNAPPEFRLAIAWNNDEKAILNPELTQLIIRKLETMLYELPASEDGHIPKFFTAGLSSGVLKIVCYDQKSADWLKSTPESLENLWEGAKFEVILQSELNLLRHVYIPLLRNQDSIATFLKRIEKQNPELKTDKWRLNRETTIDIKRTLAFLIDEESNDYLKSVDWRVFLGVRQCKFIFGREPRIMPPTN